MIKRVEAVVAAGVLVMVLCTGGVVAAEAWVETVMGRYPGATQIGRERLDLEAVAEGVIGRQAVYETRQPMATVRAWYARWAGLAPTNALYAADGCVWLTKAALSGWVERNLEILLCATQHGTRVVVNDSLRLWR